MKKRFDDLFKLHLKPFLEEAGFVWSGMRARHRRNDLVWILEIHRGRFNTGIAYSFGMDIFVFWFPGENLPAYKELVTAGVCLLGQGIESRHWPDANEIVWGDWRERGHWSREKYENTLKEARKVQENLSGGQTKPEFPAVGLTPYHVSEFRPIADLAAAIAQDFAEQVWPLFDSFPDADAAIDGAIRRGNAYGAATVLARLGRIEEARRAIDAWDAPDDIKKKTHQALGLS